MHAIERHWYRVTAVSLLLLPLAWLYCGLAVLRRALYRWRVLPGVRLPVPVIVIGNLTVGGSGKTPVVMWVARLLGAQGYRPGIITRGYRGAARDWPRLVGPDANPTDVGDEPVLLARRAGCPVVADPNRARGAQALVAGHGCNVIVSDDGLQHYRLARDIEIAVMDGARRLGNGFCLPAGPLREPPGRLATVDARVTLGVAEKGEFGMTLKETALVGVASGERRPADALRGSRVHALAGIGNPVRFFDHLRRLGVEVIEHPFPDHHGFVAADLGFADTRPVLMTEKDAVKCERFADDRCWYLAVEAQPQAGLGELILERLRKLIKSELPAAPGCAARESNTRVLDSQSEATREFDPGMGSRAMQQGCCVYGFDPWCWPSDSEKVRDGLFQRCLIRRQRVDKKLLDILVCPVCKGPLTYDKARAELVCRADRLAYPIRDDIPVMLEDEARKLTEEELPK